MQLRARQPTGLARRIQRGIELQGIRSEGGEGQFAGHAQEFQGQIAVCTPTIHGATGLTHMPAQLIVGRSTDAMDGSTDAMGGSADAMDGSADIVGGSASRMGGSADAMDSAADPMSGSADATGGSVVPMGGCQPCWRSGLGSTTEGPPQAASRGKLD